MLTAPEINIVGPGDDGAQRTKLVWRQQLGWDKLNVCQQEALEMIASKVARILNSDPGFADLWRDIAGYAQLAFPRAA